MNPTPGDVHIDAALTSISIAYFQEQANYIASRVFPSVPVSKQTDKYWVFDKNDALRDRAALRAPGTESVGGGFRLSTSSYSADVYAWHQDLDDQTLKNADAPLNLEAAASRYVMDAILRQIEADFVTSVFATSIWATDNTTVAKWDNYTTSTPVADIEAARLVMLKSTGRSANTLVLGPLVYSALKNHPDFKDRIKYTSSELVTQTLMARYFEVDRVFVANAINATNLEGETAAYDFMYGKSAWLGYVAPSPAPETPSAGYMFTWTGVSDGGGQTVGTVRIPIPERRVVRIESQMAWDFKVTSSDLGYFFSAVVS
jgi:hypothetical protein